MLALGSEWSDRTSPPVGLPGDKGRGAGGVEESGDPAPSIIQPAVNVVRRKRVGGSDAKGI